MRRLLNTLLFFVILSSLNCNNSVENDNYKPDNTWYMGLVGANYIAPKTKEHFGYFENLNSLYDVWIASQSNFGYSIVVRYEDDKDSLNGRITSSIESLDLKLYKLILDGRTYYSSRRFGPSIFFLKDSVYTPIYGKTLVLLDSAGYCFEDADSLTYVLKINPSRIELTFKIDEMLMDYLE